MSNPYGNVAETLKVSVEERVATLTLNRPAVLNCINQAQREALQDVFERLAQDDSVGVIVLAGSGRAFCAGQDQRESATMTAQEAAMRIEHWIKLFDAIRQTYKPIIARLHGYVAGAGLQLALLSDLRIAAEDSKLGMTELNVGSAAIYGSTLLVDSVGEAAMKRLVLMAEFISSAQALNLGLVHEVMPADLLESRVADIASRLLSLPPSGIRLSKEWWRKRSETAFREAWNHARKAHAENYASGTLSEGARHFMARKKA